MLTRLNCDGLHVYVVFALVPRLSLCLAWGRSFEAAGFLEATNRREHIGLQLLKAIATSAFVPGWAGLGFGVVVIGLQMEAVSNRRSELVVLGASCAM